ncbi:hypothetical protein [Roseibacillus persicicus]|nr:hypothetical protein [Roseibacillus persicicus]
MRIQSYPRKEPDDGFTMVVTITMMVLLSLIAVGILSLSAVTLRSSSSESYGNEARANARLALQIALGELQAQMGSDRAVAAPAASVHADPQQPHLLGAWESWSWDPTEESGTPDYKSEKSDRFRGWLTSHTSPSGMATDFAYANQSTSSSSVKLLGEGTFGTGTGEAPIRSELIPIKSTSGDAESGNLAWTVLSEDTKVRLDLYRDDTRPTDNHHLASNLTFPETYYRDALDISSYSPTDESDWGSLISSRTLDAASGSGNANSAAKEHFFDYTTYSRGVLSDVANGGLKRDLTTILENDLLAGQRVYSGTTSPFGVADPHWSYLSDYYNQYLNFQDGDATEPVNVTANLAPPSPRTFDVNDSSPEAVALKPVVAKLQILFSMVTHTLASIDGSNAAATYAREDPRYTHLKPWLVFEPVITLWNPYSVPIEFDGVSIGLDKIPVAFRFAKQAGRTGAADLRIVDSGDSRVTRNYWPLSNFVWGSVSGGSGKSDAITNFSFNIRGGDMENGLSREPIRLEPGENKIFTALVKQGDTWGEVKRDFVIQSGNSVGAEKASSLVKNVDFVEGWNPTGGFRFDHLARYLQYRNPQSLYSFEQRAFSSPSSTDIKSSWFHWCALRPQDSIIVKAKLSNNDANSDSEDDAMKDFTMLVEMDRLGGISDTEILGSSFRVTEKDRLYEEDTDLIIERSFTAVELEQRDSDSNRGGKTPFAVFTMTAKSSNDLLSPTKGWLYGNPALIAYDQDEDEAPQPVQSYEFSFRNVDSLNGFPMVEIVPEGDSINRGYFGSGQSAETGLTASPMFVLPTTPMVSLGQFQAANLIAAVRPPFFNYPFGNSHAHPLLDSDSVVDGTFVDHSYLLNQKLWDSYYFSGLSKGTSQSNEPSVRNFIEGESTLTPRLQPYISSGESDDEVVDKLSGDLETSSREIAAYQMLEGPFNVHSTSVAAWKSLIMSAFEIEVPARDGDRHSVSGASAFSRFLPSYSESSGDLSLAAGSGDVGGTARDRAERWLGFHRLTDDQAELLAEEIVEQIKNRCIDDEGPFLSLSEFVNRRVGGRNESFSQKGVLQTAIDLANDPTGASNRAGEGTEGELFSLVDGVGIQNVDDRVKNPDALIGNTAEGSPATLLQGDLLQSLGSLLTVRSDTFRIRAYGNSVAKNGQIQAQAWCEAIVQRVPEFVDSTQTPGTQFDDLNPSNAAFGRRFKIVSFAWLSPEEV